MSEGKLRWGEDGARTFVENKQVLTNLRLLTTLNTPSHTRLPSDYHFSLSAHVFMFLVFVHTLSLHPKSESLSLFCLSGILFFPRYYTSTIMIIVVYLELFVVLISF